MCEDEALDGDKRQATNIAGRLSHASKCSSDASHRRSDLQHYTHHIRSHPHTERPWTMQPRVPAQTASAFTSPSHSDTGVEGNEFADEVSMGRIHMQDGPGDHTELLGLETKGHGGGEEHEDESSGELAAMLHLDTPQDALSARPVPYVLYQAPSSYTSTEVRRKSLSLPRMEQVPIQSGALHLAEVRGVARGIVGDTDEAGPVARPHGKNVDEKGRTSRNKAHACEGGGRNVISRAGGGAAHEWADQYLFAQTQHRRTQSLNQVRRGLMHMLHLCWCELLFSSCFLWLALAREHLLADASSCAPDLPLYTRDRYATRCQASSHSYARAAPRGPRTKSSPVILSLEASRHLAASRTGRRI